MFPYDILYIFIIIALIVITCYVTIFDSEYYREKNNFYKKRDLI